MLKIFVMERPLVLQMVKVLYYMNLKGWDITQNITAKGYSYSIESYSEDQNTETSEEIVLAEHTIQITVLDGTTPLESTLNQEILDVISTYPTDGSYGYYWPQSGGWLGTTQDIYYLETLVAEGDDENRSYCVGLTWEVFMRAWEIYATEQDASLDISYGFSKNWMSFVLIGMSVNSWEVVLLRLLRRYGDPAKGLHIGKTSNLVIFYNFWRNNGSGHNNIFIDWERILGETL